MKQIATALLKAQSEMSNPKKGATNPFFKSKYADLNSIREAVIPILNANGISVLQPIVHVDNKNFVKTILLHESGELMESLTEIIYNKVNDAQAQGSGISYERPVHTRRNQCQQTPLAAHQSWSCLPKYCHHQATPPQLRKSEAPIHRGIAPMRSWCAQPERAGMHQWLPPPIAIAIQRSTVLDSHNCVRP